MDINQDIFRILVEQTREAVFVLKEDKYFLYVNNSACEVLGYSREELMAKSAPELSPSFHVDTWPQYMETIRSKVNDRAEIKLKKKDGALIDMEAIINTFDFDNQQYIYVFCHDITQKKQLEERVYTFSRVIEQNPGMVIITNTEGNIEFVNSSFSKITGYSLEEVKGRNPRLLKSGDLSDEVYRKIWTSIIAGNEWHGELHNFKKSGEDYWVLSVIFAIKNEQGEILHFASIQEDITEMKRTETTLLKRNAELERFSKLTIDRELKMSQLKKELGELKLKITQLTTPLS